MEQAPKFSSSWWRRNRGWLLCLLIPFVICFAAGAKVGWWFVERDAGRYARDFGKDEPDSHFYSAAAVVGGVLGAAGGVLGLGAYGCFRLVRQLRNRKS